MEADVFELSGNHIGKIWKHRTCEEVQRIQDFYAKLETDGLLGRVKVALAHFPCGGPRCCSVGFT